MRQNQQKVSPMSNEGRNTYVIEHITDALLELLQSKTIDQISISELCDAAGVGRASFYRNYECKEDILKMYIRKIFYRWMEEHDVSDSRPIEEQISGIFAHFMNYRDFYNLLHEKGLIYLLKDIILGIWGPKLEYSNIEAYATAFVSYGLWGWIEVWFDRGMQESAEEIEELLKRQGTV